ncbi:MAG: YhcH/YjgK/YiaL family protein [Verrucomicrobia bacterium]|jgi:biofilm protein TabA|nr:YhcH/YjgK/YiaL family protein [Verrucomicrobiota bacterium]MBT7065765.1 YhcH/YjgK/YiaL family protein [Verrucomicrobiota bacterium]MBT7700687.1 YhcH/YjgK/YiaL family protein [Verrucomicrobiota bacterium]
MILDQLDNRDSRLVGALWDQAFDFLAGLDADAAEGKVTLQGDDLFAMIESYDTRAPESALPEAHRVYTDIQMLLAGREQIAWWPAADLAVSKPYVPESDILFYERPAVAAATLELVPGRFAVFFPRDAHMPCLHAASTPTPVKKVVIKMRLPAATA